DQAADDFVVPVGVTWSVTSVDVQGIYSIAGGPASAFNVYFYADNNGLPGNLIASQSALAYTNPSVNTFSMTLIPPIVLGPGTSTATTTATATGSTTATATAGICNPGPLPGDFDSNGKVDVFDFSIFANNFGKTGTAIPGDLNCDGKVDVFDFSIFANNFGK